MTILIKDCVLHVGTSVAGYIWGACGNMVYKYPTFYVAIGVVELTTIYWCYSHNLFYRDITASAIATDVGSSFRVLQILGQLSKQNNRIPLYLGWSIGAQKTVVPHVGYEMICGYKPSYPNFLNNCIYIDLSLFVGFCRILETAFNWCSNNYKLAM